MRMCILGSLRIPESDMAIDFVECHHDSANFKQFEFLELRRDSAKSK